MIGRALEFSELDQVVCEEKLSVVVFWIRAQSGLQASFCSGVIGHFVQRHAQQRRGGRHFRIDLQPFLQYGGDRKSTRLNSSHRCISYAVFCLKKKKNKKLQTTNNDQNTA